jgi:hypothetical protein
LRARGQLQAKFRAAEDELRKLRSQSKVDAKRISDLTAERNALLGRLKDRNEELVEKKKMNDVRAYSPSMPHSPSVAWRVDGDERMVMAGALLLTQTAYREFTMRI